MKLSAFDTETHLIQPGLAAPPLVCGSVASDTPGDERLLAAPDALATFRALASDSAVTVGGHSLDYDFGVVAAADPSLVPLIFQMLEDGRAVDAKILEKLHEIATTGLEEYDDHHLTTLEKRYLGIDRSGQKDTTDDTGPVNGWRLSYALLEHKPIAEWPPDAVQYPRDDARGTHSVLLAQLAPKVRQHEGMGRTGGAFEGVPAGTPLPCFYCDGLDPAAPCTPPPRYNVQCLKAEMRAAWFLRLASIWGMRTDPGMVPHVVAEIVTEHENSRRKFFAAGITRVRPCVKKEGVYERGDSLDAAWLDAAEAELLLLYKGRLGELPWVTERLEDLERCRKALRKDPARPLRYAEDKGYLAELVTAAYHGDPPLTEGGESGNRKCSTSRDTLVESGDPLLEDYGEAGPNEKLLSTYVDVLTQGTTRPICPEANSLVATQRTSYRKPNLQQLPRSGWVRYCFVPRGYVEVDVVEELRGTLAVQTP